MKIFFFVLDCFLWPLSLFFWLPNRMFAQRCPNCASIWRTELIGEWDGEDWHCHRCGQFWTVKGGVPS